jgi:hypothetical protein
MGTLINQVNIQTTLQSREIKAEKISLFFNMDFKDAKESCK